jgi:hypothetical protein
MKIRRQAGKQGEISKANRKSGSYFLVKGGI